jgi:hypothetical protein
MNAESDDWDVILFSSTAIIKKKELQNLKALLTINKQDFESTIALNEVKDVHPHVQKKV